MASDGLTLFLEEFETYGLAAAFALGRFGGLMTLIPLFSRIRLTGFLRYSVALALALPTIPGNVVLLDLNSMAPLIIPVLMLKEFFIGITLGFVLGIPFWAAEAAGEIVDLQRGATMATLIDPMMTHEISSTGTLLTLIHMILFIAAGGIDLIATTVYDSYALWPVDRVLPIFSQQAADIFFDLLTQILGMALILVFPLVTGLILTDALMALLAKASPHLNIFALTLVVKTLVFSVVLVLYASFLVLYVTQDLGLLQDVGTYLYDISCTDCS